MQTNRVQFLDAFRGLAVLSVVLFHYTDRVPYWVLGYSEPILPGAWSWGWVGPYWFFMISGYFMSASIGKSPDIIAFLAKRVSRIYPGYIVAIFIILAVMSVLPPVTYAPWNYSSEIPPKVDVVANFFFATDLGFEHVDGAFWTLVVELKFYLYLAILFFFFMGRDIAKTTRFLTIAAVVLGGLWLALNSVTTLQPNLQASLKPFNSVLQTIFIALDLPFFALGMLAHRAIKYRERSSTILTIALLAICLAVIGLLSVEKLYAHENTVETLIVFAAVCVLFFALLYWPKVADFANMLPSFFINAFVRIGVVSYAWYLIHQDIGVTTIYHLNSILPGPVSLVVVLIGTYLLGELLSATVEWRFRAPTEALVSKVGRLIFPRLATNPSP